MHRTTLASAGAGFLAVDFGHHALDFDTFRNAVTMTSVGAGDRIPVVEMHTNSRTGSLLTRIKVNEARNVTRGEFDMYTFFEFANGFHGFVSLKQTFTVQVKHGSSLKMGYLKLEETISLLG